MSIHRAYKTKLAPTRNQRNYFKQCGRVSRTVFNWLLADYMHDYEEWHSVFTTTYQAIKDAGIVQEGKLSSEDWQRVRTAATALGLDLPKKPSSGGRGERKKKLNAVKKTEPKLQKITTYPYVILQSAADNFDSAIKRYSEKKKDGSVDRKIAEYIGHPVKKARYERRCAKGRAKGRIGDELDPYFPRFKRRDDPISFSFTGDTISFSSDGRRVKLPKIGWVTLAEVGYINLAPIKQGTITVSQQVEDWYISVAVEEEHDQPALNPIALGVSVGVMDLAATSTGAVYENPRSYAQYEKQMERLQRELSRRTRFDEEGKLIRGSNWEKTRAKIEKLHRKIANVRSYHQNCASKGITDTLPQTIVIKDMDVQKMQRDGKRHINRRIADAGMGEVRRQIEYKAAWNGTEVIASKEPVADLCSSCGQPTATINYTTRMAVCASCGYTGRATLNMAINLSRKAEVTHA